MTRPHSDMIKAVALTLLLALVTSAQTYPPSQTPQQRVPQTDPYPPTRTPNDPNDPVLHPGATLPGGIQLPPVRWPKRKPKDDSTAEKSDKADKKPAALPSIEGSLRELAAKHLILETSRGLLRFRLLPKTRFQDKAGEPVRDSLLQPGDHLDIQANADDAETALFVTLLRSGSDADRAAKRPIDTAAARPPEAADLGGTRAPAPASPKAPSKSKSSKDERATSAAAKKAASKHTPRDESAPRRSPSEATSLPPDEQILADARDAAAIFGDDLPPFVALQLTNRSASRGDPPDWRTLDSLSVSVTCVNGNEDYSNIRNSGTSSDASPLAPAALPSSDFVITLRDIFDPATETQFRRIRDGRAASRPAYVYEFAVAAEHSEYILVADNRAKHTAAYRGQLWIDKESRRVLRIEQEAEGLPASFPIGEAAITVEYAFVRIGNGTYLLPSETESTGCHRAARQCSKTTISYRDYRPVDIE